MIVLGIDTATPATAVGLTLAGGRTLEARDDPSESARPGHATRLLPLAHELLAQAHLGWGEIERIAVGVGPGTFTGLRIGVASARGLAQSLDVELVGVSSLYALAHAVAAHATTTTGVLAAIDARRGEVFAAAYRGDVEIIAPRPLSPNELDGVLEQACALSGIEHWVAVGDGALRYRSALSYPGVLIPEEDTDLHKVRAEAICALGQLVSAVGRDHVVVPDYRRRPDAELALEGAAT
jgi:tRNA threonylcarbamoyladenosine biosynthesis protein TsaB